MIIGIIIFLFLLVLPVKHVYDGHFNHSDRLFMPDRVDHPVPQLALSLDDILNAGLIDLLEQHPDASYIELYGYFAKAAEVAETAGDSRKAHALVFVMSITSMMLTPSEKAAPFQALARDCNGNSTFTPEDLKSDQIDLIAELANIVNHQLLRARLADLVWLKNRRKGIAFARMAIDAYCTHPINFDSWHLNGEASWHRALTLAISLSSGAKHRTTEIEAALIGAFDRALSADTCEPMFYVRPLLAERRARSEAPRIAFELERLGRKRRASGRIFDAESFFNEAEKWYERARLGEKQAEMLVLLASTYAAQADAATSAIARHEFIARAIKAYRDVPGQYRVPYQVEEAIAELRTKLASAGRLALGEMHVIRGPEIDLTAFAQQAIQCVQGKSPMNALLEFCALHPFPNRQALHEEAQDLVRQSLIGRLSGGVTLAGDGRAIARRLGAEDGAASEASQVAGRATQACCEVTAMIACGMIRPALETMQLESYLTPHDFLFLATHAGFVPRNRVDVVAKGLYAGYCGDYVQAIHILVPQFEYMVRVLLQDACAHTTIHDADGLDTEAGLSNLVRRPQMIELFGEDLPFTIQSIMCEQEGPNLRNAVAHGMADSTLCEGMHGVYAWWLILRLVVSSYVADQREAHPEATSDAASSSEARQQG